MTTYTDLQKLWQAIEKEGGINAYIETQLTAKGYLINRQDTDQMSKRELSEYKKQLKAEALEKRRLKKEAYKAYKANHIVHLGESIYWNDADNWDKWDLENANERAAENEIPIMDTPKDLAKLLDLSVEKLRWLSYHREAATRIHYHPFEISKKNGDKRSIFAPLPLLKSVQRSILHNITEKLPVHGAAHGFLSGRSIFSNALVHTNSDVIVKMDIKDFFPSVTLSRVRGIFRKAGYGNQIATLLALLTTEAERQKVTYNGKNLYIAIGERCLPQGAPTSPSLTNTLCLKMDRRLKGFAEKQGLRYTRYADDLTFSHPEGAENEARVGTLLGIVSRIVRDEGFTINTEKTRILRRGDRQKITGLIVNENHAPRVLRKLKRNMRATLHNLKCGKPLKEGDSLENLLGYAAYIHMSDPKLGGQFLKTIKTFLHTHID